MSHERWIAFLVGAITVVVTLVLLALFERSADSKVPFDCFEPTERERVRQLAFDGVDKGLVEAMAHLFDIWQRDPANEQPKRAQVGTVNAVNAHARARKLITTWEPPTCDKKE